MLYPGGSQAGLHVRITCVGGGCPGGGWWGRFKNTQRFWFHWPVQGPGHSILNSQDASHVQPVLRTFAVTMKRIFHVRYIFLFSDQLAFSIPGPWANCKGFLWGVCACMCEFRVPFYMASHTGVNYECHCRFLPLHSYITLFLFYLAPILLQDHLIPCLTLSVSS